MLFNLQCVLIALAGIIMQATSAILSNSVSNYGENQTESNIRNHSLVQKVNERTSGLLAHNLPLKLTGKYNYDDEAIESRKKGGSKKGKKKEGDLLSRILPMMIIPFMLQTGIIPIILSMLKMMLVKSALIGSLGIIIGLINMLTKSSTQGGVYTHDVSFNQGHHMPEQLAHEHYGYTGGSEYGAYVHRRSITK